jgi:fucose 4-O-acetylase-like acetyltransferase
MGLQKLSVLTPTAFELKLALRLCVSAGLPPYSTYQEKLIMKTNQIVRKACYVAVMALLCFAPGAMAQKTQMNQPLSSTVSVAALTRYSGVLMLSPFNEEKRRKKKVAVPEGGAAALYLLLAAGACFGAMFVRSRRQVSPEKTV